MEVPDAGLVAADARTDLVEAPGGGLGRQQRVRDQCPGHRDGVGLPQLQDVLRLLRLVDPPGDEDRHPDRALAAAASGAVYALGMVIGGTMWFDPASVADVPATMLT